MKRLIADDGDEIKMLDQGRGRPVVLLHEWASSHLIWEPIARRLIGSFRVIRWDARGHGGRRRSSRPITIGRLARDLDCLLRHEALTEPVVVAHSMAALILWEYIRRYGCGALGRIVIVDMTPRPITDGSWRLGVFGDWPATRNEAFIEEMRQDFVAAVVSFISRGRQRTSRPALGDSDLHRLRDVLASLDAPPLIEIWESIMAGDWRDVLPTIDVPALLVYGGESNYYSVETGRFVRNSIPDAMLTVYKGADHFPHLADPDRFARDLAAFAGSA